MRPPARVCILCPLPPPAEQLLRDAGCSVFTLPQQPTIDVSAERRALARSAVPGVSAVAATLPDRIDAEFLDAAGPALRIVANYAVGFDNIDLDACKSRRVRVTNTPGVLTDATADLAWTLILAAARRALEGDRLVRSGGWTGWTPTQLLGLELAGSTLGILGAGRIGTAVARRAVAFGMNILYTHPRDNPELENACSALRSALCPHSAAVPPAPAGANPPRDPQFIHRVDLDDLLRRSDVLSIHVPLRPENHHLLNADRLALMKPNAVLVNTARGSIVDESALVRVLRDRSIAAAALDVYEHEPRITPGLAELPNVVLLPHLGSATHATRQRMSRMVAENILAVLAGRDPPNPVT